MFVYNDYLHSLLNLFHSDEMPYLLNQPHYLRGVIALYRMINSSQTEGFEGRYLSLSGTYFALYLSNSNLCHVIPFYPLNTLLVSTPRRAAMV